MPERDSGICRKCRKVAPVRHEVRDRAVHIVTKCAECGTTEALVNSDAATWRRRREIVNGEPARAGHACLLNCNKCGHLHRPQIVFLNVTNRCNMNCPICMANIPGMGYEFHPPLRYFERVLDGVAEMAPQPIVHLFGGEPTVRQDMFEIVRMAQARGLEVAVVTNGLRLGQKEYCKRVCESGVRVLLSFDGRDPEIYAQLRRNRAAYGQKLKAIRNLKEYSTQHHTIVCCVARTVNDKHMRDLIDFCHENRDFISDLHLIPLAETWSKGEFDTEITATIGDVEESVTQAFPGERVEFLPAGVGGRLDAALSFFGVSPLAFGGGHPNCESVAIFRPDEERYHPISSCMKRSLPQFAEELVRRAEAIEGKLSKLDPKRPLQRWWGQLIILKTFGPLVRRSFDMTAIIKGHPYLAILRIIGGMLVGRSLKNQLEKHTVLADMLYMVVLPFEEYHSVESERLKHCTVGFVFEDPDTGHVRTVPACAWRLFRDEIERKVAAKYAAS